MTKAWNASMDEHHQTKAVDFFQRLLFEILLRTDGRTTDILETLMDDKMSVRVIAQEQVQEADIEHSGEISGAPYYKRESILVSEKRNFVVSHNIALVCSKYVPAPMFEALSARQEGIGETIGKLGLQTSRRLVDCGWRSEQETADLFQKPFKLHFPRENEKVPYKKYCIYFQSVPGIYLIEYFNPHMIRQRLNEFLRENQ